MTIEEMKAKRKELDKRIAEEEERLKEEREAKTIAKIDAITDEEKKLILLHMEHGRSSCSDDNPCNGYSSYNNDYRCTKCMIMEIFNKEWGGRFDFRITAEIIDNEK